MEEEFVSGAVATERDVFYLAYLLGCSLRGETPFAPSEGIDLATVHALACRNGVEGTCWQAVEALAASDSSVLGEELSATWRTEADRVLWRRVMFDMEREAVVAAVQGAGLSCLPLKGAIIAPLYPRPEMRSMCDNDILYGYVEPMPGGGGFRLRGNTPEERQATVEDGTRALVPTMEAIGYEPKRDSLGAWNADTFTKAPIFNFEMHRVLVVPELPFAGYYENPWLRAVQDADNPLAFSFSREDTYIYHIAHAYKHDSIAGCGVRFVVDERVLLDAWGSELDWGYVGRELGKLGMADYERELRALADAVLTHDVPLDGSGLSGGQRARLLRMTGDGTFGTVTRKVERGLERAAGARTDAEAVGIDAETDLGRSRTALEDKLSYAKGRIFLGEDGFKRNYPFFRRHPKLLFLAPAWRVARGLACNGRHVMAELKALAKAK